MILHINASPRAERSYSLKAARAFIGSYLKAHPGDTLENIDLYTEELPVFDGPVVAARYRIMHGEKHTAEDARLWKAVEKTAGDFKRADKYVISSPMWNFGLPYRLKQYIDLIVQPGYTFSFSPEKGYQGLVTGHPVALFLARGGAYPEGSGAAKVDFQKPYLEHILRFIGFTEIRVFTVEPTLQKGPQAAEEILSTVIKEAREAAKTF
ncbi:MAG TPA: NAD(P)H-dependent oxidoreductase [archaeon]|nr:NAD(P)H-dependent oxidoreductase [archaeon]